MKTLNELKEERGQKEEEINGLLGKAEKDFTSEDQDRVLELQEEIKTLNTEIEAEEKKQQIAALRVANKAAGGSVTNLSKKDKKEIKNYSFIKAIRAAMPNGKAEGFEAEMHQEAEKEAREAGVSVTGVGVPQMVLGWDKEFARDMEVGAATAGGNLVATDLEGFIPALRPRLTVREAGAQIMPGLVGNLDIPKKTGETTAVWEGEDDANAETTPTIGKVSLTPHRLGAYTEITKQLMAQSSYGVENLVREDLTFAIQKAVDYAALAGNSGSDANQPDGILYTSGIGAVYAGGAASDGANANGAAPVYADVINLETEIATDNADMGRLAYIFTPGMRGTLKQTKIDAGSGLFVWQQNSSEVNGYRAFTTTQLPSNLTKGSGTNLHAAIFGNFQELIIGQWAGLDLVVDPYTLAKNAKIVVVANSWWDVAVRHAESFAAGDDFVI